MLRRLISILCNVFFALTLVLSSYILINTLLMRKSLPPGACPIEDNRTLIIITIIFASAAFILSFFEKDKKVKSEDS
jgi:preprotein translocase subunit SecG